MGAQTHVRGLSRNSHRLCTKNYILNNGGKLFRHAGSYSYWSEIDCHNGVPGSAYLTWQKKRKKDQTYITVRKLIVSWHHVGITGGPSLKPLVTLEHYRIEGFKGVINRSPIMPRDASLSDTGFFFPNRVLDCCWNSTPSQLPWKASL